MDKTLKKNILKGSAATSIGTISGMIFQFLTIMIMTRYVTKDDFGIYVLVIVIVNMFNLLGGLGLELTMVKSIASDDVKENQDVLIPVLVMRSVGVLLFSLLFFLSARYILHFFDERINNYIWYIITIFILANYRDLFYNLMQGLHQFKQYSIVNVTSSIFRVILVFAFVIFSNLTLANLLIIEILSTLQPLVHQMLVIPFIKLFRVKPKIDTYKRISKFSVPLYLNNLVVFINGRVHYFIIGAYLNPASIANYDIAQKVPDALKKIFQSFIIVYFPSLAKLFSQGDKKAAVNLIEKSLNIFSIVITFFVIISSLFRNELTLLLFSYKYLEVSLAFALLILNFFIRGLGDLMGYPFVPAGYPSVPPKINTIGSIVSITFSIIFVPLFGYMGAVYALLIMNFISTFQFYYYLVKYDIKPNLAYALKPALLLIFVPVSFLFSGSLSIFLNILLFIFCLVVSWFFINDIREMIRFLIMKGRKLILQDRSA